MHVRIWIALALCASAAVARADTVKLANGDELSGEIVEWAVDYLVLDHPQLGRLRLSLGELAIDTVKEPSPGLFGTDFLRGWSRRIDFGLNGKQGNSETSNLTMGLDMNYADKFKRWSLRGRYFFNQDEDGVSDNNARVDLRRDFLVPLSRWFGFSAFSYQFDEFESWKHRYVWNAGPGYHLIEREDHALDGRFGAAYTREFGERQVNKGEGFVALDYTWKRGDRYTLTLSNQLFVELTEVGEFRNLTLGDLTIALTEDPGLSLRIGAENEYETDIEPGDLHNDLKYYLTLGLDF